MGVRDVVTIVGGGISGLTAAIACEDAGVRYQLFEGSRHLGGKIQTSLVGDQAVDAGADAFLARGESVLRLCDRVGLSDELETPRKTDYQPFVYRDGQLFEFPKGTFLGVPSDLEALRASGLISRSGCEAAKAEAQEPSTKAAESSSAAVGDQSVGEVCRKRLGDEICDYLLDPLIGGINAGSIDDLCFESATPLLADALVTHGSLTTGVSQYLKRTTTKGHSFYGLKRGTASLIDAVSNQLDSKSIHLNSTVTSDTPATLDGPVLLACGWETASRLINTWRPDLRELLWNSTTSNVASLTVEVDKAALGGSFDSPGVLFPRVEDRLMTGCTWLSSKWDRYRNNHNRLIIRMTCGRNGDATDVSNVSDDALADRLWREFCEIWPCVSQPMSSRIVRWPNAIHQYLPGHNRRVSALRQALREPQSGKQPIFLAGAAFDGVGIPSCVTSANNAAEAAIESVL